MQRFVASQSSKTIEPDNAGEASLYCGKGLMLCVLGTHDIIDVLVINEHLHICTDRKALAVCLTS